MRNFATIFLITLVVSVSVFLYIRQTSEAPGEIPIRIAVPQIYTSALVFIAKDKGFFTDEGLNVQMDIFPYGRDCFEQMIAGRYDLSVAYITPIIKGIVQKQDIKILTELHSSSENTQIIYRKDKIKDFPEDLYLNKVGLVKGTHTEFLLSLFSGSNLLDVERIEVVYQDIPELETSLRLGTLAAAIFWQPQSQRILNSDPKLFANFKTPFYTEFSLLTSTNSFLKNNPEAVEKFIKALTKAQLFLRENPESSHKMVLNYLPKDQQEMSQQNWQNINISLGLSQMFMVMLESELKWERNSLKFDAKSEYSLDQYIDGDMVKKYLLNETSHQ